MGQIILSKITPTGLWLTYTHDFSTLAGRFDDPQVFVTAYQSSPSSYQSEVSVHTLPSLTADYIFVPSRVSYSWGEDDFFNPNVIYTIKVVGSGYSATQYVYETLYESFSVYSPSVSGVSFYASQVFDFNNFKTQNVLSTSSFDTTLLISSNTRYEEKYIGNFGFNRVGLFDTLVPNGTGTVEKIEFSEYGISKFSIFGNIDYENYINNSSSSLGLATFLFSNDDFISGSDGNDTLGGFAGNDLILGNLGSDIIDGGSGTDTASFNINKSAVSDIRHLHSGGAVITSSEGTDTLINIESLSFLDGTLSIKSLIASRPLPTFASIDNNGASSSIAPTLYTGPDTFLEYELLGNATGDVIIASSGNDFMNLLGGDDAANGGLGDDVLDGGTGSNFLTGGGGTDTFFLDGRGVTTTWSTITDFTSGDTVNIWGWVQGTSQLLLTEVNAGVGDYKGATYHYDLDGINGIDTSITFSNLTPNQINSPTANSVEGNGYLLFG